MKKIISFLLVIAIPVCIFASCSNGDSNNSPTEKEGITEAKKNTETVTISSRNNQEPLEIIYDDEVVYPSDIYSSEVRFWVSDAIDEDNSTRSELWVKNANKNFSVSFISDITAKDDYNASLGDASVVIKFTELEKCILGNGNMVFYCDELWYDEFKTRYYYYEKDGDLIKFTFKEQISDESLSFILGLFEFK